MASPTHTHAAAAAVPHSTGREGIVTGLLGAAAVAVWFLLVDAIGGRPLHTPALLGAIVSGTPDPALAAEGADRFSLAALYTPIHLLLFAALGIVVMFLVHRAQRTPSLLALLLMLFLAFEVAFTGLVALLEQGALGTLAWYQIAAGNLVAAFAIGWYVLRNHPGLGHAFGARFDDRG